MCLVAFAAAQSDRFSFVLASNRDEFFDRPTLPMAWWSPSANRPQILSGRDTRAGGTWLGLNRRGRLGLVTNVRSEAEPAADAPSRGELVPAWLHAADHQAEAALAVELTTVARNGFNFVAADIGTGRGWWHSNQPQQQRLDWQAGVWGLSNAQLQTPWPKVVALRARLAAALAEADSARSLIERLFVGLTDRTAAADVALRATMPLTDETPNDRERQLSAAFIRLVDDQGRLYGTRCSTVVVVESTPEGSQVSVVERSYDPDGNVSNEVNEQFSIGETQ